MFEEAGQLVVRGVVDLLWQEPAGQWHVLLFDTVAAPGSGEKRAWQQRQLAWTLAAAVVQRRFGVWPRSVRRYHCADGVTVSRPGQRLPLSKVQQAVLATR